MPEDNHDLMKIMHRRKFITISAGVASSMVAGCVGENSDIEPPDDVTKFVGDVVDGEVLNFRVNGSYRTTDLETHHSLSRGEEIIVVDITAKNVTSNRYTSIPNPLSSTLSDIDGNHYDPIVGSDTIISSELLPGELDSGIIPFIVPDNADGLYLRLDEDYALPAGLEEYKIAVEFESQTPVELTQDIPNEFIHDIGEPAEYNEYEITVENVETANELDMYREAGEGNKYLILAYSTKGVGGSPESRARHLTDFKGYNYQQDSDAESAISNVNDQISVFEIPENLSPFYWVYKAGSRGIEGKKMFQVQ